jgi:hypothetical protein
MTGTMWAGVFVGAAMLALSAMTAGAAEPSAAERAAIFKAAGFKAKGDKYVRCEDDVTMSYSPGRIEMEDLNADGTAEAWVKEGSLFCYGNTAEFFVLLTKEANGTLINILESVGVPMTLEEIAACPFAAPFSRSAANYRLSYDRTVPT